MSVFFLCQGLQGIGQRHGISNCRRHSLAGEWRKWMRGIAHQHQVLLMKVRNNVGINRTPEMYALRISDGQQMGNRTSPSLSEFLYQRIPAKRVSILRGRRSKARRVQLREPDYVLFVHRQDADRQTAIRA